MRYVIRNAVWLLLVTGLLAGPAAIADSLFVISDPPVDFQVIDADDGSGEYFFDGIGDFLFPTFGDVALGTFGEGRSMVEFDLSGFTVPAGEVITSATFEVKFTSVGVWGLGIEGQSAESLAVDGYIGNGLAQESDFQIADGNLLDSAAVPPDAQIGDVLRFDVTAFANDLVNAEQRWLGLTLRAETFGGDIFWEGQGYPKLSIRTEVPEPSTLALGALAGAFLLRRRRGAA
ncbi:MAG TPA: PEP-CTERM sorting domain-containing protein [Phycisphaerae bacterium]|nr:PEP-CTERM sorting domain-containing protein [Phycisphaerae bacterium]HNU46782.1 PEP-CTERM sorting domain-containing protein [Phycisphaerae bacterium]